MRRLLLGIVIPLLFAIACLTAGLAASMHPLPELPEPSPCGCGTICAYNYQCGLEQCPHTLKGGVDQGISNPGDSTRKS